MISCTLSAASIAVTILAIMIKLPLSLRAWKTDNFDLIFKKEVADLDTDALPLQQGLKYSSIANADNISVILLKISEDIDYLNVTAGLLYTGIIAGCNCADDPTPVDEVNEYCEVLFHIDKITAVATVSLIE